jgi:hypothetical protein
MQETTHRIAIKSNCGGGPHFVLSHPRPFILSYWYIGGEFVSGPIYITISCALSSGCRRLKDEAKVQSLQIGVFRGDKVKFAEL